jgi:CheY-like chemotaxis protein
MIDKNRNRENNINALCCIESVLKTDIVAHESIRKDKFGRHNPASLKILLVEDNETNQKIIHRILSRSGHICEFVDNGLAAYEAVHRKQFDIILMDIHMPIMDGISTTERIRADELEGKLPQRNVIIALSSSVEQRERCIQVGVDEFLTKPVAAATLLETISRLLSSKAIAS